MNSQLILAPTQHNAAPFDRVAFLVALDSADFIGPQYSETSYLAGKRFMQLLVFMGCAPNILTVPKGAASDGTVSEVDAESNQFLLQISIPEVSASAQLYSSKQTKTPNCPKCKQALSTWRDEAQLSCLSCDGDIQLAHLNWRRSASVTRAPIVISPIFQGEAVPSDALIQLLKQASGGLDYGYAYIA